MKPKRPTRRQILQYALEGLRTYIGVHLGYIDDDEMDELEGYEAWLEREIEKAQK